MHAQVALQLLAQGTARQTCGHAMWRGWYCFVQAAALLGGLIGPAAGGLLADVAGIRAPFTLTGCAALMAAIYGAIRLPETMGTRKSQPTGSSKADTMASHLSADDCCLGVGALWHSMFLAGDGVTDAADILQCWQRACVHAGVELMSNCDRLTMRRCMAVWLEGILLCRQTAAAQQSTQQQRRRRRQRPCLRQSLCSPAKQRAQRRCRNQNGS